MAVTVHSNNSKRSTCPSGFSAESHVAQITHLEPSPPWLLFVFDTTMPADVAAAAGETLPQANWEGMIDSLNRLLGAFVTENPNVGLPHDSDLETRFSTLVRGWVNMWHEDGLFVGHSLHVCPETTRKEFSIAADTKKTLAWTSYHINMVKDTNAVKVMHGQKLCCCRFNTDPVKNPCLYASVSGGALCCKYKYNTNKCKHQVFFFEKQTASPQQ